MNNPKIFDYFCNKCGFTHEAIVENNSEECPDCPVCGEKMTRLMPAPLWKWTAGCRGF